MRIADTKLELRKGQPEHEEVKLASSPHHTPCSENNQKATPKQRAVSHAASFTDSDFPRGRGRQSLRQFSVLSLRLHILQWFLFCVDLAE